jgi:hypothetical protein
MASLSKKPLQYLPEQDKLNGMSLAGWLVFI